MKRINRRSLFAVAAIGMVASLYSYFAAPCPGQLWGIQPTTNRIVRVDPQNGMTFGGFIPPGGALVASQQFGGLTMAEHGAVMLYQNPVANPTDLFRINPTTGTLLSTHFMPAAGNPSFRAGLSFHSDAGVAGADAIYAINDGGPVQRQDGYDNPILVDHTAPGAAFAGGLGGDDNGRQFLVVQNVIREFDPSDPGSFLSSLPLPLLNGVVGGLAYDGTWIYLSTIAGPNGQLFTINPDTGAILRTVNVQGGGLIGLAARPVPEPTAALLAAASLVAVCGSALRTVRPRRR